MKRFLLSFLFALLCMVPCVSHAQGFGLVQKKAVSVNRLLPPTVNLKGKKIRVDATATAVQDSQRAAELLKTKLITLIQKDPRFILNETSPETILKFSVTNFYLEKYKVGSGSSATESNRGKIEVAYQAIDALTNAALDSENLVATSGYDPAGHTLFGMPFTTDKKRLAAENSENEARDQLVTDIVNQMAQRIAPLDQPFDAPLPGGKLEPISSLAMNKRWGDVEEQAEKLDKFPKPEADAYRTYLVALAKEAQAYDLTREANDRDLGKRNDISAAQADAEFQKAQKDLDEASALYKQCIQANPKEKEFRPGDTRTEQALAIYAKIERFKAENAKAVAAKAAAVTTDTPAAATAGGKGIGGSGGNGSPTPLDQVLDFCTRGMAVASILEYIDSPDFLSEAQATGYKFNFGRDSARLSDACKTNAAGIQSDIRKRLSPAKPVPARK